MTATTRSGRAVTLIELLVVISIITLLAALLGMMTPSITRSTNVQRAKVGIQLLSTVLELYHNDCGMYPDATNHNPDRSARAISPAEPDGEAPTNADWRFYVTVTDETAGSKQARRCTQLVGALCSTDLGWGNPQFFDVFKRKHLNGAGQLVDPWGRRYFYMSAVAYTYRNSSGNRPPGGTTITGRTGEPFHNAETYQVYSAGPDSETPPDSSHRAGTDDDDITNW